MSLNDFDGALDQYVEQAPQMQLTFDPMINDMIVRLQNLDSAIKWLRDSDTRMNPDVKESVLANMQEEDDFCRAKLQQAWDNIPEFQAQGAAEEPHPNQVIGNQGESEAFTEVVVVDETPAPKKRAPRKAATKTTKKRAPRKKKDT